MNSLEINIKIKKYSRKCLKSLQDKKRVSYSYFENFNQTPIYIEKATNYHNTLCGLCNSNCHECCKLEEISDENPNKFINCVAFNKRDNCTVCGHNYSNHYYACFLLEKTIEKYVIFSSATKSENDLTMKTNEIIKSIQQTKNSMFKEIVKARENIFKTVRVDSCCFKLLIYLELSYG